jgi:predicted nucleotidyltransferase
MRSTAFPGEKARSSEVRSTAYAEETVESPSKGASMGPAVVDDRLLLEAARRLADEFHPERIYLFGSRAWGEPAEDSDYDFMVVVGESDETPLHRAHRARKVLRGMHFAKDILVKTRAEFDRYAKVHASLECQILEQGRLLYG